MISNARGLLALSIVLFVAGCVDPVEEPITEQGWDESAQRCWDEGDCTYDLCITVELEDCRYFACIEAVSTTGTILAYETDLAFPTYEGKEEIEIPSDIDCATVHIHIEGIHPFQSWVSLKDENGLELYRCTISSMMPIDHTCIGEGVYPGVYVLEWSIQGTSSTSIHFEGFQRPDA